MRYAIAPCLLAFMSPSLTVSADWAFVLDKAVCENQAISFDAIWAMEKKPDEKTFFFDGVSNFSPVGHDKQFDGFSTIYMASHGGQDRLTA
jgi:hypothetical protein